LKWAVFVTTPTLMTSASIGKYQIQPRSTDAMKTFVRSLVSLNMTFHFAPAK
jgi:hypothetical protein